MSKDKKNEGKEILEELKELSEWQKRNQEYLKKKAEEEAALAEEKEKERQARMASKSEESDETEDQESESDPKDPESAKEESEEKVEDSEEVKKEVSKEKSKSTENEGQDKKREKKPVKKKSAKPKIPAIHILRALTILFPSLLLLIVSAYLLSPYATMKDIRVEGTVQTTDDDIRQASGIQDSDYTINLLLDKAKYEEQIKSNYWVESAQLVYQFPTKFTIKVKEYDIVAYYISGENHYPILSSGQLETSSVSLVSLPETYLSVLFNDSEQIKTFTSELAQISPELKAAIQKVELAPSKVTSDLIRLTMNDSDEVLVPLSEMSKKLPYYSKIKPQLSEPSVIDMEAGIYSYTVADKLIMEAEEKAKKEAEEKAKEEQTQQETEAQAPAEESHSSNSGGYFRDRNGRWHRPNGKFASKKEIREAGLQW